MKRVAVEAIEESQSIDNRVGDWRDPFRTRGPSEVVVFAPQKVLQGVDFLESITEISIKLGEGHYLLMLELSIDSPKNS